MRVLSRLFVVAAAVLAGVSTRAAGAVPPAPNSALADCSSMATPLYRLRNSSTGNTLLTRWSDEASSAGQYGFVGEPPQLRVARQAGVGLIAVSRMYKSSTGDFLFAGAGAERSAALKAGYVDQGVGFFAGEPSTSCGLAMTRMVRGATHFYATPGEIAERTAAGWRSEQVSFVVTTDAVTPTTTTTTTAPPPTPTTAPSTASPPRTNALQPFSFAVIPDTQDESYRDSDERMPQRVRWLLDNRAALNLAWVLHSGDVHSWDTADHNQFVRMSSWTQPLVNAGLPQTFAVGNHDTNVVCPGGSACPGANANIELRNTATWNAFYPPSRFGYEGTYQAGKSDNAWRTVQAGGAQWMLMALELWPRTEVINWARSVIAAHPTHNVIVVTHSFLDPDGAVSTYNGGYGANSPAALWAALDDFPNVQMIFSGHAGSFASTTLRAADGHPVLAMLQCFHDPALNPTRIVTVDPSTGAVTTRIVATWNERTNSSVNVTYAGSNVGFSALRLVGVPAPEPPTPVTAAIAGVAAGTLQPALRLG